MGIGMQPWQSAFIAAVIFISPIIAMIMLWTRAQACGLALLGVSMAGALVFGLDYHFLAAGADNVSNVSGRWSAAFQVTAALLGIIEAGAFVWSVWTLARARRSGIVMS